MDLFQIALVFVALIAFAALMALFVMSDPIMQVMEPNYAIWPNYSFWPNYAMWPNYSRGWAAREPQKLPQYAEHRWRRH